MKHHLKLTAVVAAWMLTFALVSAPAYAEEKNTDKKNTASSNMEILRQKIQADKKLVVAANMELTESEAKAFWPIYEEFQMGLSSINERIAMLIAEYAQNFKKMTDETANKLLKDYLALEKERLTLRDVYLPKFQTALPAIKVARYYQIENKIQAILQYELAEGIPLME
jgi:hypothetical protein